MVKDQAFFYTCSELFEVEELEKNGLLFCIKSRFASNGHHELIWDLFEGTLATFCIYEWPEWS